MACPDCEKSRLHSTGNNAYILNYIYLSAVGQILPESPLHKQHPANGFYTEEERIAGKRVGFMMNTIDGKKGYLAHQDIKSDFHIRRYGISIENIDAIAVPSITPGNRNVIILDEIGKMECFSGLFRKAVIRALDSANIVIGTITLGGDDFIMKIKDRADMEMHEVTLNNRDYLPGLILKKVSELLRMGSENHTSHKHL